MDFYADNYLKWEPQREGARLFWQTLTEASNLVKFTETVRLLGSTCIITGVGPAIAQTIVHLGIDLSGIITRNQLSDGIRLAFELTRQRVVSINSFADAETTAEKGDSDERVQSAHP